MKWALSICLVLVLVPSMVAAQAQPIVPGKHPTTRRVLSPDFRLPAQGPVKIAFFDADSTLRVAPSGAVTANGPRDVAILPLVAEVLRGLEKEGYLLAVASNQGGIQEGYTTIEAAEGALVFTMAQLSRLGASFHWLDFAEASDENRKPKTGMARRLAETIKTQLGREVDWSKTIMVGDSGWKRRADLEPDGTPGEDFSNADRRFAENMAKEFGGVQYHHPRHFFHWMRYGVRNFPNYESLVAFVKAHPELDPGVNEPRR